MFHKEKPTVALHEGGNCGSQILSVHMYFCGKNYRDKQGQFLWLPVRMAILILPALCMPCIGSSAKSSIFFYDTNTVREWLIYYSCPILVLKQFSPPCVNPFL